MTVHDDGSKRARAGDIDSTKMDGHALPDETELQKQTDVSERERAEQAIAHLAAIIDSSEDAIISKTLDGTILSWNLGAQRLFGYTPGEAIGQSVNLIVPPERREEEQDILARLAAGERIEHFETVRVAKGGRRIEISLTISPIRNGRGQIVGASKVARDITPWRRTEASLRESNASFRRLASAAIIGIIRWNLDRSQIVEANDEFLRMTGYDRSDVAEGRLNFRAMTPPEWTERNETGVRELRETGVGGAYEKEYFRKDGSRVPVIICGVRFDEPSSEGMSFVLDITERKKAESENQRLLREVEAERQRLADVFQSAPSFMCVLRGPNFVFERANGRYLELIGRRDIIGKPVLEALPELGGQGFIELLERVYRTGEQYVGADASISLRRGDQLEQRTLDFVYQPMCDAAGVVTGILVHGVDHTERKDVENSLARVTAESEQRRRLYETILANTPDFVYVFSLDYCVLYANEALLTMWGVSMQDTIGKTFLEIGYEPWHAEMHCREIDRVRETKRPIRGEVPFNGAHGRRIYDYIFVPVLGVDGEVEVVAGTTRDITDRVRAEEELRTADRKKNEFIALLAHELRNPLAPLRNGLEVMRLADADISVIAKTRGMMERQLRHMIRLIDDLLDISRISQNKIQLRRSRVLLSDIVSSAVETARPAIESAQHHLTLALPPAPLYLDADLTRLAQVFSNLLTNSAKYTERGGSIALEAERLGSSVVVAVRDNGIGIPEESLPHIFDMFAQVDRSIERSAGGLGIGLALVKGLVEMHGGSVAAQSPGHGKGSLFAVTLPILNAPPEDSAAANATAEQRGSSRKILVVDDNRDSAISMAMMLRLTGNEVRTAHDGLEAVNVAEQFRPQIILMDVGMPLLNGLEATRRIRQQSWGRPIIVALTGWSQDEDRLRSLEAGCDGHLMKPVDANDLETFLAKWTADSQKTDG
ncbi:MAG: PAS domain S-box protein [Planctomycetota bacterium]